MNELKEKIEQCQTMEELDSLRLEIVKDSDNVMENQKIFIKQKNKIKYGTQGAQ